MSPRRSQRVPRYEERILAWIDVLGWSDLIHRSTEDPAAAAKLARAAGIIASAPAEVRGLKRTVKSMNRSGGEHVAVDLEATHFSDSYVLSTPVVRGAALVLVGIVQHLSTSLLEAGHFTRGAIVRGQLHHRGTTLYGPAVTEAHNIEKSVAVYPRIVVTPHAAGLMLLRQLVRKDHDGLQFLDIFGFGAKPDLDLDRLRRDTEELARVERNLKLKAKYEWMANYIRHTVETRREESA